MSTGSPQNPLLGKMDALIKKHRGPAEATPAIAPPSAWLPVLTEVVVRGTPPAAEPVETAQSMLKPVVEDPRPLASADTEQLANQLLDELGPKLSAIMEQQLAAELRKNLDETVATLLSQFDASVRDVVRNAVAEKLKTHKPDS